MEEAKSSKPVIDLAKVEDIKNRETQKYLNKARKNSFSGGSDTESPSNSAAAKRIKSKSDADSEGEDKNGKDPAVKKLSIINCFM